MSLSENDSKSTGPMASVTVSRDPPPSPVSLGLVKSSESIENLPDIEVDDLSVKSRVIIDGAPSVSKESASPGGTRIFETKAEAGKTLIVSSMCIASALVGGYLLYQDLNEAGGRGEGAPVATVQRRENKVRRKAGSSYVWTQVKPSEDLFRKDSVQTGEDSAASIALSDGSSLDIGESSLVVMDETTELTLGFIRGTVVVHKSDGDTRISVDTTGKRKVEHLAARLLTPVSLAHFFVEGDKHKPVEFTWDVGAGERVTQLEISTHKKFTPGLTQKVDLTQAQAENHRARLTLPPGDYYWRVQTGGAQKDSSDESLWSSSRRFRVISVQEIQTISPNQPRLLSEPGGHSAQFRWVNPLGSLQNEPGQEYGVHQIELSHTRDFGEVFAKSPIRVSSGVAVIEEIPESHVFWRVRSKYEDVELLSQIKEFDFKWVLLDEPLPPPIAPKLLKPDANELLSLLAEHVLLEARWEPVDGAKKYEVTLWQDGTQLSAITVEQTAISLKNLKPGNYAWSARALGEVGPGEAAPIRPFKVTYGEPLAPPTVISPEVQ